jgi:hypothetical protein
MTSDPRYDLRKVEAAALEVAAELCPEHLSAGGLSMKIVADPEDRWEVETAALAIANLRKLGLFRCRDDGTLEPTRAALHAVALLT